MNIKGAAVSQGVAVCPAFLYRRENAEVVENYFEKGDELRQKKILDAAIANTEDALNQITKSFDGKPEGKIFAAHKEILGDEEILEMLEAAILTERKSPDYAVMTVFEEFIQLISKVQDPRIASRAVDLKDVRDRLINTLHNQAAPQLPNTPFIIVSHDLSPGDTVSLDKNLVKGIVCEIGGATSHSAILANALGIPAVLGATAAMETIGDNVEIGLDAIDGVVYVSPDSEIKKLLNDKAQKYRAQKLLEAEYVDKVCQLKDGKRISLGINIGDAEPNDAYEKADFIGLFRTEFLYMAAKTMPTEEEQFNAYKRIMLQAKGKPVTLRTLDIGGDKTLPYLDMPKEENPFLGNRALRLCFDNPPLFMAQLRAALRASAFGEIWIMLPMAGTVEDIKRGREFFELAKKELDAKNIEYGKNVKFGIMIEIPAIAIIADIAAQLVDFASIGTNDLTQYTHAADRMNPKVRDYYQPFSTAMARLINFAAKSFKENNKPLSVCGEMAGDPNGAVLLAGLGIEKLSVSPAKMSAVKAALAAVTLGEARETAKKIL